MTTTPLKSLAHPDWPYSGTAHEWRGFVRASDNYVSPATCKPRHISVTITNIGRAKAPIFDDANVVYQKQNFGPELK